MLLILQMPSLVYCNEDTGKCAEYSESLPFELPSDCTSSLFLRSYYDGEWDNTCAWRDDYYDNKECDYKLNDADWNTATVTRRCRCENDSIRYPGDDRCRSAASEPYSENTYVIPGTSTISSPCDDICGADVTTSVGTVEDTDRMEGTWVIKNPDKSTALQCTPGPCDPDVVPTTPYQGPRVCCTIDPDSDLYGVLSKCRGEDTTLPTKFDGHVRGTTTTNPLSPDAPRASGATLYIENSTCAITSVSDFHIARDVAEGIGILSLVQVGRGLNDMHEEKQQTERYLEALANIQQEQFDRAANANPEGDDSPVQDDTQGNVEGDGLNAPLLPGGNQRRASTENNEDALGAWVSDTNPSNEPRTHGGRLLRNARQRYRDARDAYREAHPVASEPAPVPDPAPNPLLLPGDTALAPDGTMTVRPLQNVPSRYAPQVILAERQAAAGIPINTDNMQSWWRFEKTVSQSDSDAALRNDRVERKQQYKFEMLPRYDQADNVDSEENRIIGKFAGVPVDPSSTYIVARARAIAPARQFPRVPVDDEERAARAAAWQEMNTGPPAERMAAWNREVQRIQNDRPGDELYLTQLDLVGRPDDVLTSFSPQLRRMSDDDVSRRALELSRETTLPEGEFDDVHDTAPQREGGGFHRAYMEAHWEEVQRERRDENYIARAPDVADIMRNVDTENQQHGDAIREHMSDYMRVNPHVGNVRIAPRAAHVAPEAAARESI